MDEAQRLGVQVEKFPQRQPQPEPAAPSSQGRPRPPVHDARTAAAGHVRAAAAAGRRGLAELLLEKVNRLLEEKPDRQK